MDDVVNGLVWVVGVGVGCWCGLLAAYAATRARGRTDPRTFYPLGTSLVWCGVVWCSVVWCGVVWCGVEWCG